MYKIMEVSENKVYSENFGYQEQNMQVLKRFPLLSLSGEEEVKFDQGATQ